MKIEFCGFPVYASALVKDTTYNFWLHPDVNQSQWQVDVDLAKNSTLALDGKLNWKDVVVDAGDEYSGTKLVGWQPDKPPWESKKDDGKARAFTGVLYLKKSIADGRGLTPPVLPPQQPGSPAQPSGGGL